MKHSYAMNEAQIESLAHDRQSGAVVLEAFDGTYLRALVNSVQSVLGQKKGKRPDERSQLGALEKIATPFYAAVLRGVTTADIAIDANLEHDEVVKRNRERNRRATFARTAKSTLVAWVRAGGDIRAIDVSTVTKSELRASTVAAQVESDIPAASRVLRAQEAILRAVARDPPAVARERLYAVISALQEALDELPLNGEPHHESTVIRTRVGQPTFREARVLNRGAT